MNKTGTLPAGHNFARRAKYNDCSRIYRRIICRISWDGFMGWMTLFYQVLQNTERCEVAGLEHAEIPE